MKKGAQPTYFHQPHIKCQKAACSLRAANWPPLVYMFIHLSLSCRFSIHPISFIRAPACLQQSAICQAACLFNPVSRPNSINSENVLEWMNIIFLAETQKRIWVRIGLQLGLGSGFGLGLNHPTPSNGKPKSHPVSNIFGDMIWCVASAKKFVIIT